MPTALANFTATPKVGSHPLTVLFQNSSSNAITYLWIFGDGTTANSSSATFNKTYNNSGSYTVTLQVTGSGANNKNSLTRTNYINVDPPPVTANFNAVSTTGSAPANITFLNTSTNYNQCFWIFGDGQTSSSTTQNIMFHKYTSPGTYTVTLQATASAPYSTASLIRTNYIVIS